MRSSVMYIKVFQLLWFEISAYIKYFFFFESFYFVYISIQKCYFCIRYFSRELIVG